jgi:hypothetical protein
VVERNARCIKWRSGRDHIFWPERFKVLLRWSLAAKDLPRISSRMAAPEVYPCDIIYLHQCCAHFRPTLRNVAIMDAMCTLCRGCPQGIPLWPVPPAGRDRLWSSSNYQTHRSINHLLTHEHHFITLLYKHTFIIFLRTVSANISRLESNSYIRRSCSLQWHLRWTCGCWC